MRFVAAVLLLAAAAHATVLFDTSQQQIVDTAAGDGEYVVLLNGHVSGPRAIHTAQHTILTVAGSSRDSVQQAYPDAVVAEQKPVFADELATPHWNLDRIDERELAAVDGTWTGPANGGAGVRIYIVDTGVDGAHPDFGGRVTDEWSAYGQDTCTHGTHVAGIAAGNAYGVARGADIRAIKVLGGTDCDGTTGSLAGGLSHILSSASGRRAVINLSLGFYGFDAVIDSLIQSLRLAGHVIVAAAGNDGSSACVHYPSSFSGVLSVAATDRNDVAASFSNYGVCVDCYAPGVRVVSARAFTGGNMELSGTSMAAPHVAGVAALIRQRNSTLSGTEVEQRLLQTATQGAVTNRNGSPDLLLYWAGSSSHVPGTTTTTSGFTAATTGFSGGSGAPCVVVVLIVAVVAIVL